MRTLLGKISLLLRSPIVARAAGRVAAPGAIRSNHLKGSASSYLSRASRQPVDWYPWGEEAFRRAKDLNRPILLDLGAEWCPYCAQMDRESYNRPDLAKLINDRFVAVKVDYDMQPELAVRLQRAQAFMNLPVGLPLTAFLTPSGKLYFSGGYFSLAGAAKNPPSAKHWKTLCACFKSTVKYLSEAVSISGSRKEINSMNRLAQCLKEAK